MMISHHQFLKTKNAGDDEEEKEVKIPPHTQILGLFPMCMLKVCLYVYVLF